jgi:hypothetical protein
MVEVHKKIISPQYHCQNITLNDHYIYKIIFLIDFFSLDTHIHLDYNGEDLIMSHYAILWKMIQ